MRRAAKRDAAEADIVQAFRDAGVSVRYMSYPGAPDLVCGFLGVTHLVEVKSGRAGLRATQKAWQEGWQGEPVKIARTAQEAIRLVRGWWEAGRAAYRARIAPNEPTDASTWRKHDGGW